MLYAYTHVRAHTKITDILYLHLSTTVANFITIDADILFRLRLQFIYCIDLYQHVSWY